MNALAAPITGLTLFASLSPLLTFLTLWQLKEWRWDRLREHLRSEEGWLRQLFGMIRPAIIGASLILTLVISEIWPLLPLTALAALAIAQMILRKQRTPVWTKKAMILFGLSILLNAVIIWTIHSQLSTFNFQLSTSYYPLIPLLQPFIVALSWGLFYPIDVACKKHIMKRAMRLRSARPNMTVIGITGSVGKTTTKELLNCLLRDHSPIMTPAYVNSDMGVAQWMIREFPHIDPESEQIAIIEMGAYRTGEIRLLCRIAQPQMGVVTFVGSQHIGLFGSAEALCSAKAELVECLPEDGTAFINADNTLCERIADAATCPVVRIGTGGTADLEAYEIEETPSGIAFKVDQQTIRVPLHGTHNVTNVLLAIAVARKLGMDLPPIAAALQSFRPPSRTFSVRQENGITILDDTHNASPTSFRAAIAWAKNQPVEHRILLTPGLIELGAEQERIHRELGTAAREIFSDVIFTQQRNAASFAEGFGRPVSTVKEWKTTLDTDTLLVCVGRIPSSTIERLLSITNNQ